ncbi:MAG: NAD(P)/FAD-dependent oxidoreductase, partial [Myxococcota bacterium]
MEHEHIDVLIVGAGLSGIGAAHHIQERCPSKSMMLLEARGTMGGTWDLFRYPGIRSDSDMYTFGYRFKPWLGNKALADGPSILRYIQETAQESGIDKRIRYHHRVVRAEWSTADARWTVHAEREGEPVVFTADFLYNCSGYYRYDKGYTPDFPGMDSFEGTIVHPQLWPEDLDYRDKRVVVIGSGATAVTLIPSMASDTAHITMLQRSPTYIATVPPEDAIAMKLRELLPEKAAYMVTRWKNILHAIFVYQMSQRQPERVKAFLRDELIKQLPDDYPVDVHFKPRYNPWDQRLCAVPGGDLFQAISAGDASVVTDTINRFTPKGILLDSGDELEADIIVTATGFTLQMMGGAVFFVDGEPVEFAKCMTYMGMMLSEVPTFAFTIGYTISS